MRIFATALLASLGALQPAVAGPLATYIGGPGSQHLNTVVELPDGTVLAGGSADSLDWLPPSVPRTEIAASALNGTSIDAAGATLARRAFILHLSSDLSSILKCIAFPVGTAHEVQHLRFTAPPGETDPGALFLSGRRGGGGNGGFFVARLNGNFLSRPPTALEFVINVDARGIETEHALRQPWDVQSDGAVVLVTGNAYEANWMELVRYLPDGVTRDRPAGWRLHQLDNGTKHYGPAETVPPGRSVVSSSYLLKTQRTNDSGLLRSFTLDAYLAWSRDENGYWRRGSHPLDTFWNNFWKTPLLGVNNANSADVRGYTGYKLAGTGNTEGSPYTPRVGALVIDRRNNFLHLGLNWQTRLPGTNNPDFEPAFLVHDASGRLRWWARLYREYDDNSASAPQSLEGAVNAILGANGTLIRSEALIGATLDTTRVTTGSTANVNGYRRLYWLTGANANTLSEIGSFDASSGTLTLVSAPARASAIGDRFVVDGTVLSRTLTSTPDQYVDAIAIDYASPLRPDGSGAVVFVVARTHGNNVSNFWSGDSIAAVPGASGHQNRFTGTNGNEHLSWAGRLRDDGSRGTLLAATYIASFEAPPEFSSAGFGARDSDPNLDFWPSPNAGWPNLKSTRLRNNAWVDRGGRLVVLGESGRLVQTTRNAYQRQVRPFIRGVVADGASTTHILDPSLRGAQIFITGATRLRFTSGPLNGTTVGVTDFDGATGRISLGALSQVPSAGTAFVISEGLSNWSSFVRVYAPDLSTLVYSSLLDSSINPVNNAGAGNNTRLRGVFPSRRGVVVVGHHAAAGGVPVGSPMPVASVPSWGMAAPVSENALLARLPYLPEQVSGYGTWLASFGTAGPLDSPSEDADGDGLQNLLEYRIGGHPFQPEPGKQPKVVLGGDGRLLLETDLNPAATGVNWRIEATSDLAVWTDVTSSVEILENTPTRLRVRDAILPAPGQPRFLRLRVTEDL